MKKLVLLAILAVAAISSSCSLFYEESVDTIVEFGFADTTDGPITMGLEQILESSQYLLKTFDNEFRKNAEQLDTYEYVLRGMNGKKKAEKKIKSICDSANKNIKSGFTCPVDMYFVARMRYGSADEVTVWYHDYR